MSDLPVTAEEPVTCRGRAPCFPTAIRSVRYCAPKTAELIASYIRGQVVRGELKTGDSPVAAGLLAARRSRQDLDDLNACVQHLVGLVESDKQFRDADAWSQAIMRFHDLVLERSGNRTLAVQAGVLREVVAMHLSTVVMRTFDHPDTQDQFRKLVRSYRKLVLLIDARDADGAEQHWRTHLEVMGRRLLRHDTGAKSVVDLFG
jgi:GntR family transcriptional regulator, transcriptional repressor for pyruvate dehydrogenase complex